jgi:hypothetical protein
MYRCDILGRDARNLGEDGEAYGGVAALGYVLSRNLRSAYLQNSLDKLLRGWQVFFERGLNLLGRKDEPATLNRVGP